MKFFLLYYQAEMDPTLKAILRENKCDDNFRTHVCLFGMKGKYQFNPKTMEQFWGVYCEAVKSDDFMAGIAEVPQQYVPVLVDVDLKLKYDPDTEELPNDGKALYTEEQLKSVVEVYQAVLRQVLENCTEQDLLCVVLEKEMYQQSRNDVTYLKHGFHLHFPIFIDKSQQKINIIPRVQQELKEKQLFSNLGIEDSGSVIDDKVINNAWLVYGSRKSEDAQPYKVTKVYDANLEVLTLEKAFKHYQIFDNRDQLIPVKGKVKEYLPRILSIVPRGRSSRTLKRGLISHFKEKLRKDRKSSMVQHNLTSEEGLELCKKLLPMLSDHRADDRGDWLQTGWAIYNITDGSAEGLDLWLEFSARCEEKYDESACADIWSKTVKKENGVGIGTLKMFAKIDSPEAYSKLKDERMVTHITSSLEGSHNDVAKALYEQYGDEFVCASFSNNLWFQYHGHIWEPIEDGVFLREKISGSIIRKYVDAIKAMYDQLAEDPDNKSKQAMITTKIKQIQKMISNLKNAGFKNSVMKESNEVFFDPKFRHNLDQNPALIAFKNGVYDLNENIFRPGRPEDYLSKCMPINYVNFSEDDDKIHEMHTVLEQTFPDKSVLKYFLDVSSDVFYGGNMQKTVHFFLGEGDNGKTIIQKFFELMLGPLSVKLNTNVITGKKPNAGSAFADIVRTGGGVRLAVLEEPDGDECINIGILKHLSGNDSFFARDLFEKGKDTREIKPLFKLIFICNKLPRMKYADKAVWNRVRVIPFESTFCRPENPAPETYEEQLRQKRFPMDKQFSAKIPGLVEAFAWILLQHRQKLLTGKEVRIEPEKVRMATEMYRKQNDIFRQFIDERIIKDDNATMSLVELYNIFKEWFRDSIPGSQLPIKNDVEEQFCKIWGNMIMGKKWKGYRIRNQQDDINDGRAIVVDVAEDSSDSDSDDEKGNDPVPDEDIEIVEEENEEDDVEEDE